MSSLPSRLSTRLLAAAALSATLAAGATVALAEESPGTGDGTTATTATTAEAGHKAKGPLAQWYRGLTDAQRTCLTDQGLTRPTAPLSDAERQARREKVKAAVKACDLTLPGAERRAQLREFWKGLPAEQRTCIKDQGITRPWGPLTKEARTEFLAKFAAAAKTCGATLPSLP